MKYNDEILSVAAYELVEDGKDIKDCVDRIQVGDWGGDDTEQKLQKCALVWVMKIQLSWNQDLQQETMHQDIQ